VRSASRNSLDEAPNLWRYPSAERNSSIGLPDGSSWAPPLRSCDRRPFVASSTWSCTNGGHCRGIDRSADRSV
jgi:hypothetical protein